MRILRLLRYRRPVIIVAHAALSIAAYVAAFLLQFDFALSVETAALVIATMPVLVAVRLILFTMFELYRGMWRYSGLRDALAIVKAVSLGSVIFAGLSATIWLRVPRSVLVIDWALCLLAVGGVRLVLRAAREALRRSGRRLGSRALIVGGGDAGEMLIREIDQNVSVAHTVVGIVDDDPTKQGQRIRGVEVVGRIEELPRLVRKLAVAELLIAVPSATPAQRRRILNLCRTSGVPFRSVPALHALLEGRVPIHQLEEVRPEELLGRDLVMVDADRLREELQGRRVLVTGAGGSIGSELCRQLVAFKPESIVLFDRAESSLYFLERDLRRASVTVAIVPVVGDIADRAKVAETFDAYRPHLVYHAAAYKHVPLMELHPLEGIGNNVFGTETLVLAAREAGVEKFVLVSTDKAVKPVGIMGMTKSVAEGLLHLYSDGPTTLVAVRFGNVLGSAGSVLPLFQWQIAHGGPVTVTDADATRYFMLPSEAAQLVLQAGMLGKGAEVFFLDMGEPVRIVDLAHNVVRMAGLEPGRDVEIEVTGLRPGERLNESLVMDSEDLLPTDHNKILLVKGRDFDVEGFRRRLEQLRQAMAVRDKGTAVAVLKAMTAPR